MPNENELQPTQPEQTKQTAQPEQTQRGNGQWVPGDAFAKIKRDAESRGEKRAKDALAQQLKQAGFSTVDEMLAAVAKAKNVKDQRPQKPQSQAQKSQPQKSKSNSPQQQARHPEQLSPRQADKLHQRLSSLERKALDERRKRVELQRELDKRQAEMALREAAAKAGVRDIGYALHLLRDHLSGMPQQDLASFEEGKFFEGLRQSHPYLYGETVRPATTGTGGAPAHPSSPRPDVATQAATNGKRTDATKLSAQEYQDLLRARGLDSMA